MSWWRRYRSRRKVHPTTHEIWKLWLNEPPRRGDRVLVDDVPHRIVKNPPLSWEGRTWTIEGPIEVEPL